MEMGESEESLLKAINHYQSGLERYMQRQDETKMLHNLGRLFKLPIRVCHLEQTGIGRTVNSLRKLDGEVGQAAKSLVAKWKEMVMTEEEKKAETSVTEDDSQEIPQCMEEKQSSSHKNTKNDRKNNIDKHDKEPSSEKRHESSKSKSRSHSSKENRHKEKHRKRSRSDTEDDSEEDDDTKHSDSGSSEDNTKRIKLVKHKKKKSSDDSKDRHESSSDSKNKSKFSSEDDGSETESHKMKSSKHEKHESGDRKKHKHKSSHERKEESSKSTDKHKPKDKLKHDSSKHDKEKKKDEKERKDEKHTKHKKSKREKPDKHPVEATDKASIPESSSSSSKKDKKVDKNQNSKSLPPKAAVINGIGSESGTSFADALGMCEPLPSKKKKSFSQPERPRDPSPASDENEILTELPLPKEPLENLDINISTLLPPITPHYRPLGLPIDEQPRKILTDDEALSRVMMNKNQRTKVFSGNKVAWGKVPSLFDICVRILQDNIDALEYTGGVPYSILKPILEKATANQLYMMEHHNPYLIEDSDELWKLHCQKEFRNKSRDELETWRDMYMRCLDEREAKLKALTANIKQSQDKSIPVRTTKLAYVDSVAKPPRNIARKQAKNDTSSVRPSPSLKLVTLATKGEAAKVSVPNPGARAAERSSSGPSHHSMKAKKAPLMAKTLTLFKNRFRR